MYKNETNVTVTMTFQFNAATVQIFKCFLKVFILMMAPLLSKLAAVKITRISCVDVYTY
jgi:hypothetical protein